MNLSLRDNLVSKTIRKHRIRIFRGYVGISLVIFLILALTARHVPYFKLDLNITTAIQKFNFPLFDTLMEIISAPGNAPWMSVFVILAIFFFLANKLRWEAICVFLNAIGFFALEKIIKASVDRLRPAEDLVRVLIHVHDPSFPSGHVLSYVSFFGFLAFLTYILMPKNHIRTFLLILFIGLIALIGLSRISLGAHWFSDTIGAYLLGSAWLLLTIELYFWGRSRFLKKDPTVISKEVSHTTSAS